jgi:hypothetical protein
MFTFQKVRVCLLCAVLLVSLFTYLGSFSLNTNLTVTAQNSLESSKFKNKKDGFLPVRESLLATDINEFSGICC